ncbi:MAG: hypothetical protein SOV71_04105 [Anaerovoracaceae bacterium]|nr:hypothetical protein [Bacillota bacterium]MDY2670722.1 hypothetical protein [Anaerovoracaceae bacterium]
MSTFREEDLPYDFETLKETKHIRRSVYDLQPITLDEEYPGDLPEDLQPFHFCFAREGHIIMIIPRNYLQEALDEHDLDAYEIAIPVKFVIEKGYKHVEGHEDYIVGNFDYDPEIQKVDVPYYYYEY